MTTDDDLIAEAPIVAALIHWLTGVVFALLLGAFLVFLAPSVPGLSAILSEVQARGIDLSMRVQLATQPPDTKDLPSGVAGYVFIDIDAAACERANLGARCIARAPTSPSLVARLAKSVLGAKPRVLIIDAILWDFDPGAQPPTGDFDALATAARNHPDVPVVAVAPFRPLEQSGEGSLEPDLIAPELRGIRFAPAFLWRDPTAQDDVVRSYSPFALVSNGKAATETTPTLPLLAALYAASGGNVAAIRSIDCQFAAAIEPPSTCTRNAPTVPEPDILGRAKGIGPSSRLVFSLPALASATMPISWATGRFQNFYDHYVASKAFSSEGALLLSPSQLKDKIVVISTSAPTALDSHSTPVGDMCGAELVLNAVHGFLTSSGWINPPSLLVRSISELEITGLASLPFLVFWICYFQVAHFLRGRAAAAVVLHLFGAVGFLLAISAAILLAAVFVLHSALENGFALEFFSAIVALSLEGFAEGARWLVDRIERMVDRFIRPRSLKPSRTTNGVGKSA